MASVQLKLGPTDQGKSITCDDFESAVYQSGFKYEIIDGRLYAFPVPNFPEAFLETWLKRKLEAYTSEALAGSISARGKGLGHHDPSPWFHVRHQVAAGI